MPNEMPPGNPGHVMPQPTPWSFQVTKVDENVIQMVFFTVVGAFTLAADKNELRNFSKILQENIGGIEVPHGKLELPPLAPMSDS